MRFVLADERRWVMKVILRVVISVIILGAAENGAPQTQDGTWRGISVAPENRCTPYLRDSYPYNQSVELEIIVGMDGEICSPYTETCFDSLFETDIEHIIALSEAHDSGLCSASAAVKRRFASDVRNLTLASPDLNRTVKEAKDAAEWLPSHNRCWFAERIVEVRLAYNLTIDRREADALEAVLADCDDSPTEYLLPETGIVNARACASITCELFVQFSPGQTILVIGLVPGTPWLKVQYEGATVYVHASRISRASPVTDPELPACGDPATTTCAALKACYGHGRFTPGHPGYHANRDTDDDGVACES